MPKSVTIAGVTRQVPLPGEAGYDQGLDDTLQAMTAGLLQADGSVAAAGWRQKTSGAAIAPSGWGRFAATGTVAWRNLADNGDLRLGADGSGNLVQNVADSLGRFDRRITNLPVVRLRGATNGSVALSQTAIKFPTVDEDTDSVYNASTGLMTFTRPGLYIISGSRHQLSGLAGDFYFIRARIELKNGSTSLAVQQMDFYSTSLSATTTDLDTQFIFPFFLPPGVPTGTVNLTEGTAAGGTVTMDTNTISNWCDVFYVPL